MSARDDISFLVGSECRVETLLALREAERRPSEIASHVSCARETAQRNLAGFTERNWVTKVESTYRLTPAGELVLESYEDLEATVESAAQLTTFLSNIDDALDRLPATLLSQQHVVTASEENPHAPINRWLDMIGTEPVEEYYGITGIVSRVFNNAAERVIGPETKMELIVDESVLKTSREQYPDALQLAYDLDGFTLFLSPSELSFGLALCDGHVWMSAYDDHGNIIASIDGDDPAFLEWARDVYERYRESASVSTPESREPVTASRT